MSGKVTVFNPETGEEVSLWPVDARELVTRCGWSTEGPSPPADVAPQQDQQAEPAAEAKSPGRGRRAGRGRAAT